MGRDPTNSSHWVLGLTRIDASTSFTTSAVSKSYMKSLVLRAQAEHSPDIDMSDLVDTVIWKSCLKAMLLHQYVLVALTQLKPKKGAKWLSGWRLNRLDRWFAGQIVGDTQGTLLGAAPRRMSERAWQQKSWCWMLITAWKHWTLSLPEQINKREKACIKEIISSFETLPNHRKPCCRSFRGET